MYLAISIIPLQHDTVTALFNQVDGVFGISVVFPLK